MGYYRLLNNEQVNPREICRSLSDQCQERIEGLNVLALSDSSEVNLSRHRRRLNPEKLGVLSNNKNVGIFIHPTLVLDAEDGMPLGLSDVYWWSRDPERKDKHSRQYKQQEIEEKESYKWWQVAQNSQRCWAAAKTVTYIADREADIYELWEQTPKLQSHALFRASRDRKIQESPQRLYSYLSQQPMAGTYAFRVRGEPRQQRMEREAWMRVRFTPVTLYRPSRLNASDYAPTVKLYALEAVEIQPPTGQKPIHWRLLTTHLINSLEQALQVIQWYGWRWRIEQLFAVLKQDGLDIESTQLESVAAIERLLVLSLGAALRILQLCLGRDDTVRPASLVFSDAQQQCLMHLSQHWQGRTRHQQNPFPPYSLAWATWVIARVGGWSGYRSQRPPGIALLYRGLRRFNSLFQGWSMARDSTYV
ncbi:MAG TPA: IS4 family transposase [Candidatus Obscuribacterales bacterium]